MVSKNGGGNKTPTENQQENGERFLLHPATSTRFVDGQTLRGLPTFVK
jgi:hypothetical protein